MVIPPIFHAAPGEAPASGASAARGRRTQVPPRGGGGAVSENLGSPKISLWIQTQSEKVPQTLQTIVNDTPNTF